MNPLLFTSDYQEGAHPSIIEKLTETNLQSTVGYGLDPFCEDAKDKIRKACECLDADVWFLVGGTQTNATVIDALLRTYQGVIAAETGHINTHEAGAIEATGHKVLTIPQTFGKISADDLNSYCETFYQDATFDHMVMPGMVYISQPTEYGTLYSLKELTAIKEVCVKYQLPLYLDGARLAYALACPSNDVSLADLARLCDVFYIGGTKCGALLGEALVVPHPELLPHFFTIIKQHGALLAKGRLLGIQFDCLFTDKLYKQIGESAIQAADRIREIFTNAGYTLTIPSPTNQVFVLLENRQMERLSEKAAFNYWEKYDENHTVVRFASSWATKMSDVEQLAEILTEI